MPKSPKSGRKSPVRPVFVPPPGRTSKQTGGARGYDDEQRSRFRMSHDEKTVNALLNEMDTLKVEADLEVAKQNIDKHDHTPERDSAADELTRLERSGLASDSQLRRLLEAEIDAEEAAMRAQALEDVLARAVSRTIARGRASLSTVDCAAIAEASSALRAKLVTFQSGVRAARGVLRDRERAELTYSSLTDQRDSLLCKLGEVDAENVRLRDELCARAAESDELRTLASRERDAHCNVNHERVELEARLGDAARRVRELEAECLHLTDRTRIAESMAQQRASEAERAQREAEEQRERAERERDAAAKSTAKLRERLARAEDALERIKREAGEKDALATQLAAANDQAARQTERTLREKAEANATVVQFRDRIDELEAELRARADAARQETDTLADRVRDRAAEANTLRAENERLRVASAVGEEKVRQLEAEYERAHAALKREQKQLEEQRTLTQRASRDKDELTTRLEELHRQLLRTQKLAEAENEQLRNRFQQRLRELEPLPELLKAAELKHQEACDREQLVERRALEHARALTDLTAKYEAAVERETDLRARLGVQQDEAKLIASRLETTERRTRELETQMHELVAAIAKRDEALLSSTTRLDEKTRENASLTRQLEKALDEVRHSSNASRERTNAREHQMHARVAELEAQAAQARSEATRLRKDKEELEQRHNVRIAELKDRLEQAATTNRSMQNYVHFLKHSYSNVFGPPRADTMTATSGFGDASLTYDVPSMPMQNSPLFARADLSASGNFSDRFLQSP